VGLIRKTASLSTLGVVDFRSDKERIARSTRRTDKAIREQTKAQAAQHAQQMHIIAMQHQAQLAALHQSQNAVTHQSQMAQMQGMAPGMGVTPPPALPAAGWYPDPQGPGTARWWDGGRWTEAMRPLDGPPQS